MKRRINSTDRKSISRKMISIRLIEPEIVSEGTRNLLATEVYVMSPERKYRQVFRHLVRGPWYAVREHGENAKVLLIHTERSGAVLATRGRIFEDLASRQGIFGNRTVIATARRLYFDDKNNRPRLGASGHSPGSVRRYAIVVQQLELTYDTRACSVEQLLALLPREFSEWKARGSIVPAERRPLEPAFNAPAERKTAH